VLALLGSACAPALLTAEPRSSRRRRWLPAAAVAVLALSTIPPFLSQRYVDDAYAVWRADRSRAYDDLDRARSLNPLSLDPLLAEGAIARAAGDRGRAIDAFRRAAERRPEEWVSYYVLAQLHAKQDPALARREAAQARARDPLNEQVQALQERLASGRTGS
jgi:tetratricopeptide (TPR) repeat protein